MSQSSDLDREIDRLYKCELLTVKEVEELCQRTKEILDKELNVCTVQTPVTVCGDIHGQFYDLLKLFEVGGRCPETQYLFLGDFIDRGYFSIECLLLLFALKSRYPDRIILLRGNHESRQITQNYGFYDECLRKYQDVRVWKYCIDVCDYLPLAAVIEDDIFCVHGGLSPMIAKIDQMYHIDRKQEIPHDGCMCDLLWSDPDDLNGWGLSPRGAGYLFGGDQVEKFNNTNNIKFILRAHQLVMDGYKWMFNDTLCTVWSAPNYCYRCGNLASILILANKNDKKFITFEAMPSSERKYPEKTHMPDYFFSLDGSRRCPLIRERI